MRKAAPASSATASSTFKLFAFTLSACIAGVAGALYVPQVGIINPSEFAPANSIEAVIWTAVGGRGTLVGPIIGAVVVNVGKSCFTAAFSRDLALRAWRSLPGVTLFLPKGIVGLFECAAPKPAQCGARGASRSGGVWSSSGSILYLDGVTVSFDGFKALNNLSFIVEPGEMRAIIGPNGAGKTTMMDVITGKTRPDAGEVLFGETPI